MNKILIGMLTYNRIEMTKKAIEALFKCTNPIFDLYIFDNGSIDGTLKYLESLKYNFKVLSQPINIGVAKGLNFILEHRKPEQHFMKLDNDMVLETDDKDWLNKMCDILEAPWNAKTPDHKDVKLGALGLKPYKLVPEHKNKVTINGYTLELPPEGTLGCATVWKNEALNRIGKFVEDFGTYGYEDSIQNTRLGVVGYITAFWPDIKIVHIDPGGETDYMKSKHKAARDNYQKYLEVHKAFVNKTRSVKI